MKKRELKRRLAAAEGRCRELRREHLAFLDKVYRAAVPELSKVVQDEIDRLVGRGTVIETDASALEYVASRRIAAPGSGAVVESNDDWEDRLRGIPKIELSDEAKDAISSSMPVGKVVELTEDEQSAQWKVERALSGLPLVRSVLLVGMRARQELARKAEGRH